MMELLAGGWALFQVAAIFAAGIVVALMGLAAVFGPIALLIWHFAGKPTEDNDYIIDDDDL